MTIRLLLAMCLTLTLSTGCNIIYKQNIQQGNALEQEDLDQLESGMSKNQVAFLLGTPAINDPFHQNRWDYVSTFSRRGGEPVRRLVTLEFENDTLTNMIGVREGEGSRVLTADGAAPLVAALPTVGVNVEDARDYEDLSLAPEEFDYWTIQVGSFSTRKGADTRLAEMQDAGFDAIIYGQVIGNVGFFIVRTGEYAERTDAIAVMRQIEEQIGVRAFLVTPGS